MKESEADKFFELFAKIYKELYLIRLAIVVSRKADLGFSGADDELSRLSELE